jgi:glucose/mannose transport system permease protein
MHRRISVYLALVPMALVACVIYVGTTLWSLRVSFTSSRTFPTDNFVGFAQYERLFTDDRWLLSLSNLAIYGVLVITVCLVLGFVLAALIDWQARGEGVFRTVFLYPYAMSFIATGVVWQWLLKGAEVDWIIDPDKVIYTIAIAAIWQSCGLVMVILLAGLRGIDPEIWKAARVDGIPTWRVYVSVVRPMLTHSFVTATILLLTAVVKLYDVVVAMTQGGPGNASDVPAKYIMDHLFGRANIGLASAGSIVLLLTVVVLLAPFLYIRRRAVRLGAR